MSLYSDDFIVADLDEMDLFLYNICNAKDQLNIQIYEIMRQYKNIHNWEDNVVERTGEILDKIQKQIDILTETIDYTNKRFGELIDNLKDYNDVNSGSFGRL